MGIGLSLSMKQTGASAGGGGSTPWYLAGGVDAANCVAAYLAKGAADYATSKVNLANPGTYTLSDPPGDLSFGTWKPPVFSSDAGWYFNWDAHSSDGDFLTTGIIPTVSMTVICRCLHPTDTGGNQIIGATFEDVYETYFGIAKTSNGFEYCNGDYSVSYGSSNIARTFPDDFVVALAGGKFYYNGGLVNTVAPVYNESFPANCDIWIGTQHIYDGDNYGQNPGEDLNVYASSFYDVILTDDQVAAITTAMQAL